jgi:hypothetical protein
VASFFSLLLFGICFRFKVHTGLARRRKYTKTGHCLCFEAICFATSWEIGIPCNVEMLAFHAVNTLCFGHICPSYFMINLL